MSQNVGTKLCSANGCQTQFSDNGTHKCCPSHSSCYDSDLAEYQPHDCDQCREWISLLLSGPSEAMQQSVVLREKLTSWISKMQKLRKRRHLPGSVVQDEALRELVFGFDSGVGGPSSKNVEEEISPREFQKSKRPPRRRLIVSDDSDSSEVEGAPPEKRNRVLHFSESEDDEPFDDVSVSSERVTSATRHFSERTKLESHNPGRVGSDSRNSGRAGSDSRNSGRVGSQSRNSGQVGSDSLNSGQEGSDNRNSGRAGFDSRNSERGGSESLTSTRSYLENRISKLSNSENPYSERADSEDRYSERADSEDRYSERADSENPYSERAGSENRYSEQPDSERADSESRYSERADSESRYSERANSESHSERANSESPSERANSESRSERANSESRSERAISESRSERANSESHSERANSESRSERANSESRSERANSESRSERANSESRSERANSESRSERANSESRSERANSESRSERANSESRSERANSECFSKQADSENQYSKQTVSNNLYSERANSNSANHYSERADSENCCAERADSENRKLERPDSENRNLEQADSENLYSVRADSLNRNSKRADLENFHSRPDYSENRCSKRVDSEKRYSKRAVSQNPYLKRSDSENCNSKRGDSENLNSKRANFENSHSKQADSENCISGRADSENLNLERLVSGNGNLERVEIPSMEEVAKTMNWLVQSVGNIQNMLLQKQMIKYENVTPSSGLKDTENFGGIQTSFNVNDEKASGRSNILASNPVKGNILPLKSTNHQEKNAEFEFCHSSSLKETRKRQEKDDGWVPLPDGFKLDRTGPVPRVRVPVGREWVTLSSERCKVRFQSTIPFIRYVADGEEEESALSGKCTLEKDKGSKAFRDSPTFTTNLSSGAASQKVNCLPGARNHKDNWQVMPENDEDAFARGNCDDLNTLWTKFIEGKSSTGATSLSFLNILFNRENMTDIFAALSAPQIGVEDTARLLRIKLRKLPVASYREEKGARAQLLRLINSIQAFQSLMASFKTTMANGDDQVTSILIRFSKTLETPMLTLEGAFRYALMEFYRIRKTLRQKVFRGLKLNLQVSELIKSSPFSEDLFHPVAVNEFLSQLRQQKIMHWTLPRRGLKRKLSFQSNILHFPRGRLLAKRKCAIENYTSNPGRPRYPRRNLLVE
ncbi:uncharacterized protein DDB_G0287625-like [Palaemon carinicauda]|uniref:uncharacterized protein DDB_G0287625-like n=1 Tax=Palaemon carinicauda TaxID=392227 RepID=UPI0035B5EF56